MNLSARHTIGLVDLNFVGNNEFQSVTKQLGKGFIVSVEKSNGTLVGNIRQVAFFGEEE